MRNIYIISLILKVRKINLTLLNYRWDSITYDQLNFCVKGRCDWFTFHEYQNFLIVSEKSLRHIYIELISQRFFSITISYCVKYTGKKRYGLLAGVKLKNNNLEFFHLKFVDNDERACRVVSSKTQLMFSGTLKIPRRIPQWSLEIILE